MNKDDIMEFTNLESSVAVYSLLVDQALDKYRGMKLDVGEDAPREVLHKFCLVDGRLFVAKLYATYDNFMHEPYTVLGGMSYSFEPVCY